VVGSLAYVACAGAGGLTLLDVFNPAQPVFLGSVGHYEETWEVKVSGDYAYVTNGGRMLRVIDVSNPSAPVEMCIYNHNGHIDALEISGGIAYCGTPVGLNLLDVSYPPAPLLISYLDRWGGSGEVAVQGNYAYALGYTNLTIMDLSNPAWPVEVGCFETPGNVEDVAVAGSYAYLSGGWRLRILDVSNPASPVVVGTYVPPEYSHGVAVSGNYVFLAAASGGLRIVNVSNPSFPVEVGHLNVHAVYVDVADTLAYVTSGWPLNRLYVVDVSHPGNPIQVSYITLPGGDHGISDIVVSDSMAYLPVGPSLRIVRISNPWSPTLVAQCELPSYTGSLAISGPLAFVCVHDYGLYVVNVSNPATPILAGHYDIDNNEPTGVAAIGATAYANQYRSFGIYDCSRCLQLTHVGMIPVNPPVIIPAQGGSFSYNISATNLQSTPATVDIWVMQQIPGGGWQGPMLGPVTLTLPNGSYSRLRIQNVPAAAPAGQYTYRGYVGTYAAIKWDSSAFTYTKLGSGIVGTTGLDSGFGDWSITGEDFTVEKEAVYSQPSVFSLIDVAPNPFNSKTSLSYELRAAGNVSLKVYDTAGRLVATLADGWREAGVHEATFVGTGLASGIYFAKLEARGKSVSQKLLLLK
jgi:hypothetical protein